MYGNSIEKRGQWAGMKNTGLKVPEKDQIHVSVRFSYYLRAKIILCFKCKRVNTQVDAFKKLEETMHVHSYIYKDNLSQDSTFDLF